MKAEITMLVKRQALEEKKFRLQKEELHRRLKGEMVKTTADERIYAAMTTPSVQQLEAF